MKSSIRKLGLIENFFDIAHDSGAMIYVNIVKIEGTINPDLLQQSLDLVQNHYPLLQVHVDKLEDGHYFQSEGTLKIPLRVIHKQDDNQWHEIAEKEMHQKFIGKKNPLCRFTLLHSSSNNSISELIATFHHGIADGISCMYLFNQLLYFYQKIASGDKIEKKAASSLLPPIECLVGNSFVKTKDDENSTENSHQEIPKPKLIIEQEAPPSDRNTHFITRIIEPKKSRIFINRCKQEKTTVHGALCAAMLFSAARHSPTNSPINLSCSSNVNLRKYCQPEINNQYLACLVSRIAENHSLDENTLFWNLARECKSKIHKSLERRVPIKLICSEDLRNFNSDVISQLAEYQMGRDMTVHVSNLGKINIPENYGNLKIKELYFSTGQHIFGSCFWLGVVTFQEKLFCTFAHVFPLISDQTGEWFANCVIDTLYQACLPKDFTKTSLKPRPENRL